MEEVKRTNVFFLIDCSGSMNSTGPEQVAEGVNEALRRLGATQKQEPTSSIIVNITGFNTSFIEIILSSPLTFDAPRISPEQLCFAGDTALYDALGDTIVGTHCFTPPDSTEDVIIVVATDGDDTSSKRFTAEKIHALVQQHRTMGVRFIYIGAGDDAMKAGLKMGICKEDEVYRVKEEEGENIGSSIGSQHVMALMSQALGVELLEGECGEDQNVEGECGEEGPQKKAKPSLDNQVDISSQYY